jgi:ABC-type Zn uptake system ZnuABC Zn-binding protein ZnuA
MLLGSAALLLACESQRAIIPQRQASNDVLQVVATTTILGDVVQRIGGDRVQVSVLVPPGNDPHSFQPAPSDIRIISEADLVITNGAGLDAFLNRLLEAALTPGDQGKIISASEGIDFRQLPPGFQSAKQGEANNLPGESQIDPHVWFDPENAIIWTKNIEQALSQVDPDHTDRYAANAGHYRNELQALDAWIQAEVAKIPAENRKLVSDHQTLGYFADRYGFELAGTLIPGSSAAAEPSAVDLAALIDTIQAQGVKAIFVGSTVSPVLAQQVAADTGVPVVPIYTDSLTPPGGQASSYLDLMRYDVQAIVEALQ